MKKDEKENQSGWTACEGASEASGKSVDPKDLPEADTSTAPTTYKEVPVGRPVSDEQYKKMKEAAEKGKPPSGGKSQVDPST
jgi:hypothetical protein